MMVDGGTYRSLRLTVEEEAESQPSEKRKLRLPFSSKVTLRHAFSSNRSFVDHLCVAVCLIMLLAGGAQAQTVETNLCDESHCVYALKAGEPVTYVAEPEAGSYFAGWSGVCTGRGECSFTPKAGERIELYARFEKMPLAPKNLRNIRK